MLGMHWSKVRPQPSGVQGTRYQRKLLIFLLTVLGSPIISDIASSVERVNKGHVRGLGRGHRTKSLLQSPNGPKRVKPLRIIQCYDDLLKRPDFVLEVMRANDLMDLI
ncbi:hypothetical protein AVEN_216981-1 [Araneus ventricosus]|uniref:Uncharacterized protein n=1 Tax=Araneus ventricosus TaxID=182803 RepID=A0A4Y2QUG1_ARAVE|nr:hypothetical protein AVEN_216981-1 [Araneus ventricosus]